MSNRFYLKVAFQNKIKKYAIQNPHQINFHLIKSTLTNESSKDSLFYYQLPQQLTQSKNQHQTLYDEQQIIDYLTRLKITPNSTIKLRIIKRTLMSEQERRRKGSQSSMQIPTTMEKKRSKSMEFHTDVFDQTCLTQCFQITTNFIIPLNQSSNPLNSTLPIKNQTSNPLLSDLQKRKTFSKSTQIHAQPSSSFIYQPSRMLASVSCSIDLSKIRNSLHYSMRETEKQKSQLEKLKQQIAKRQKQNMKKKLQHQQEINDVLKLFGIDAKQNLSLM